MRGAGVRPAVRFQRALTLAVRACRLARLGVICRLAGLSVGRSCVRHVCPQKSKPCEMGVLTVFVGDSRTPRSAQKALIRGRTLSSKTGRELAVTRKSSAPLTSLMWWTRRCQLLPCTTISRPSHTLLLTVGERRPPWGTPAVVGNRGPRSRKPLRSHVDRIRLFLAMCASIHDKQI
jgi:hypothetical protein